MSRDDEPLRPRTEVIAATPPVATIDGNTTVQDLINEDVKHANFILKQLHNEWQNVKDVDIACKLSLTTMKVLQMRRDLLNKPLGHARQTVLNPAQPMQGRFLSPYNQPTEDEQQTNH